MRRRSRNLLVGALSAALASALVVGGAPTTAATAGVAVVEMPVGSQYRQELWSRWTQVGGTALTAPRGSSLRFVLPPEAAELDLEVGTVHVTAFGTGRRAQMSSFNFTGADDLAVDMASLSSEASIYGIEVVDRVEFLVRSHGPTLDVLDLIIDVVFTDEPAVGEVVFALELPEGHATTERYDYQLLPVTAGEGTTLVLEAPPGFWNEDTSTPPWVRFSDSTGSFGAEFPDLVEVSSDGSTLSLVLPENWWGYSRLVIVVYRDGNPRYHVGVPLIEPPDDPTPPVDPVAAYVTSVYDDLFGRSPDPTGLAGWTWALTHGTPYSAVADGITYSDEFRMGLITDAYLAYLGREPDPAGLAGWLDAMRRGLHIQRMEAGFIASDEYFAAAGGTLDAWVEALYVDILGRAPSPVDVAAWSAATRTQGRYAVALSFLYSTEKLQADVGGYYEWLLNRPLDPTGRDGWVRAIQAGYRVEAIIAGIIASDEYRQNVATAP